MPQGNSSSSPASEQAPAKPIGAKESRARLFKVIKRVAAVFGLVIVLLGGYLYFYASRQQAYLTGRNLRVLGSLSTQIGAKLESVDRVLKTANQILTDRAADSAASFIVQYPDLILQRDSTTLFTGDRAEVCSPSSKPEHLSATEWQRAPDSRVFCLYRTLEIADTGKRKTSRQPVLAFLNAATYLGPGFIPGVFDKVILADDTGLVVLQNGLPDVPLTSMDAVVRSTKADSLARWGALRVKPSIIDVRLAGRTYRLFLEPCCLAADGSYWNRHLVVAGLVAKEALVRESLKISLSLVTLFSAVLILVFLGWPFLKLRMIGEREPVLARDGMLLGVASLLAAALTTIFALDLYSYTKFRADRDEDLRAFSEELSSNLRREVARAYRQLDTLSSQAVNDSTASSQDSLTKIPKNLFPFPFFESWSLLDTSGMQARKWSTDLFVQRRIPVGDRTYFREIVAERGWSAPSGKPSDPKYFLESTVSRTTGKHQVGLALHLADQTTPVATMALEMMSLIGVVLPPAYGFAVIDSAGKVLFHSDTTRNLEERFFTETDQNRELRSAVMARSADTLNLKYGGTDYRAYVAPVPGLPWSLITLLDKQPGRITNAEWLGTSVYLVLVYLLLLVVFAVLTLLFFRGYRAPWVWPDRRLRAGYLRLIWINGLIFLAFLLALLNLEGDDLLVAGFVLPLQAIAAAWACLTHSRYVSRFTAALARSTVLALFFVVLGPALLRSDVAAWPHYAVLGLTAGASLLALKPRPWLRRDQSVQGSPRPIERPYIIAAVLFLLLAGVMPAAAFFKIARSAHTEMLVKRGQLSLAKGFGERADRIRQIYADKLGKGKTAARETRLCERNAVTPLCELDLYYRFFFGTRIIPDSIRRSSAASPFRASANLVGLFLVPYRPQSSVEWRSMLPRAAHDSTWFWASSTNRLEFRGSPIAGGESLALSSVFPGFWPVRPTEELTLLLLSAAVLILVAGIAFFLARRFFLIDVTDPILVSRHSRIASVGGTNLFVVCRNGYEQELIEASEGGYTFDLSERTLSRARDVHWLIRKVGDRDPVVVRHFEYRHEDAATAKAKLSLLDTLIYECGSSVVVVAGESPDGSPLGLREAWRLALTPSGQGLPDSTDTPKSFIDTLDSLVLVDAGRWLESSGQEDRRCPPSRLKRGCVRGLIEEESRCDGHLNRIWDGLQRSLEQRPPERAQPSREELLDLLGERAEAYYRAIWESCRTAERCVLVHLAEHGLVNDKDRRTLRRLLARGLVRREPHFKVMNETFRRYLLGHTAEVAAETPSGEASAWDSVRRPVLAIVAALAILLFVTQQELFSATSAIITALATGVASFSKISGLFDGRRTSNSGNA